MTAIFVSVRHVTFGLRGQRLEYSIDLANEKREYSIVFNIFNIVYYHGRRICNSSIDEIR